MSEKTFPIQPLYDLVFVKKEDDEMDDSGFVLPESVKGRARVAKVLAVGDGNLFDGQFVPLTVKVGDKVYVREFSGYILEYKGEKVHVFKENEIVGIIRD